MVELPVLDEKGRSILVYAMLAITVLIGYAAYSTFNDMRSTGAMVCYQWQPLAVQAQACVERGGQVGVVPCYTNFKINSSWSGQVLK